MAFKEYSKGFQILFLMTVLSVGAFGMYDVGFTPIVGALYKMFPDATAAVNFSVSGVSFLIIFASPLAAKICGRLGGKRLLVLGTFIGAASGLLMGVIHNAYWIAIMRGFSVISYPMVQVSALALINKAFSDEPEKEARYVGLYNSFGTAIAAAMSIIAGYLASQSTWRVFQSYWIYVPIFIMSILFVPADEKNTMTVHASQQQKSDVYQGKSKIGSHFWCTVTVYSLYMLTYAYVLFYVSLYVSEHGLGNEAFSGTLSSVMMVGGLAGGVIFGVVYGKVQERIGVPCYAAEAAILLLMILFPYKAVAFVTFSLFGLFYANLISYVYSYCPSLVPEDRRNDAVSYILIFQTAIYCLCSFIVTGLMKLLDTDKVTDTMYIMVAVSAIAAIFEFVMQRKARLPGNVGKKQ